MHYANPRLFDIFTCRRQQQEDKDTLHGCNSEGRKLGRKQKERAALAEKGGRQLFRIELFSMICLDDLWRWPQPSAEARGKKIF
jgi:hypothetical protein